MIRLIKSTSDFYSESRIEPSDASFGIISTPPSIAYMPLSHCESHLLQAQAVKYGKIRRDKITFGLHFAYRSNKLSLHYSNYKHG